MARQTAFRRGAGNFFKANGAPGNRANRIEFDDDEEEKKGTDVGGWQQYTDFMQNITDPAQKVEFNPAMFLDGSQSPPPVDQVVPAPSGTPNFVEMRSQNPSPGSFREGFDAMIGGFRGTGELVSTPGESPSDVSTSSTGVPSKMALTAADEFMLSPGEIDFSPTAMAAPPMPEKRVFEETTPAEGPRSFWDKIGGGIKGALTSPGVGDALIATGTRVMDEGFGGLGEGLREGMAELEVGRQEKKYKDTIEEVGFGMPDHEKSIMQSMPPAQGMEYLMNWRDSERGRDARAAGLMDVLNIPPEMADTMAWDAATVDRILSRPNELQTITDGKDQTWVVDLSAGIDPEDRVAGGPIGAAKVDLTGYQLAQQQRVIDQNNLTPLFERVQAQYAANNDKVRGLAQLKAGTEFLSETDADGNYVNEGRFGEFNELRARWDKLTGAVSAADRDIMDQMLLKLGIGNLGDFKGAISEMELAKALQAAGDFNYLRESLIRLLNTEQTKVAGIMESHQKDIDQLRSVPGGSDLMLDRWELKTDPEYEQRIKQDMFDNPSMALPEGSELVASPGNSAEFGVRGIDRFRTRVP